MVEFIHQCEQVLDLSLLAGFLYYWDVVDLIKFQNVKEGLRIRIGYYRQVGNQLRWASQTTITEPVNTMKRLFAQAAKEKEWFRKALVPAARHALRK